MVCNFLLYSRGPAQIEAPAVPAHPGIRVGEPNPAVPGMAYAPGSEVCAVYAGGLDEARGGQGLTRPEAEGLPSEPGLDDPEALASDAFLHLGEVGLGGGFAGIRRRFGGWGFSSDV